MGYQTQFWLEIQSSTGDALSDHRRQMLVKRLDQIWESSYSTFLDYIPVKLNGNILRSEWGEPVKWYSYDEDMGNVSKDFPDLVFILRGVGEENIYFLEDDRWQLDIWECRYLNGKKR